MLVKVVKDSIIYQGNIYKTGTTFEIDDVIAEQLIQDGNVVAYSNEVKEEVAEDSHEEQKTMTGTLDTNQLSEMTYQDLKKLASDMGLSANGTKKELIERISKVEVEVTEEDEVEGEAPNTSMPE